MILLLVFQLICAAWGLSEILMALGKRSKNPEDRRRDRGSMILLFATVAGSLFAAQMVAFSRPSRIPIESQQALLFGIVLLVAGVALRWAAIVSLGRFFTMNVAVLEQHKVVRHGLYRWVRHPSYTGMLIAFSGIGIALGDWLSLVVLLGPITAALLYRVRVEEKVLLESLGDDYRNYCASTRRLIPFIY